MPARASPSTRRILVGDSLRRETEFTDLQVREGSTGTLIVTTQTRRIFTPRGLAITEDADTVFREEVKPGAKSGIPKRDEAAGRPALAATITPGPVDAVPLLGADLQPAPHPLRPPLRHGGRGLSRPRRARAVHADRASSTSCATTIPAARSAPSACAPARRCSTPRRSIWSAGRPRTARPARCGRVTPGGTIAMQASATLG